MVRAAVPEPLEPAGNVVSFEWMKMPDSSGFGDYIESGQVIPCLLAGQPVNFPVQMYLNDEPPITAGREIWGFPKKWGRPELNLVRDTLTGSLYYDEERIALGTMGYKYEDQRCDPAAATAMLGKRQVTLKLLPDVDGRPKVAQLVAFNMIDIQLKSAWSGPARLSLTPHVNARSRGFARAEGGFRPSLRRRPHPALWRGRSRLFEIEAFGGGRSSSMGGASIHDTRKNCGRRRANSGRSLRYR